MCLSYDFTVGALRRLSDLLEGGGLLRAVYVVAVVTAAACCTVSLVVGCVGVMLDAAVAVTVAVRPFLRRCR